MGQLIKKGKNYIWLGTFEEKDYPKKAGFRFDGQAKVLEGQKVWFTTEAKKAAQLINFADQSLKDELSIHLEQLEQERKENLQRIEESRMSALDVNLPKPEGIDYLPFQKAGIFSMLKRDAALLGDDMGLGKTIQVIGVYNSNPDIKTCLIVCPATLKLNWQREFCKWNTKNARIRVMGSQDKFPEPGECDVVIVNYDIYHRFHAEIRAWDWDLVAADEAHYMKNPKARRTIALMGGKLEYTDSDKKKVSVEVKPVQARVKIMATGTPMNNRPIEIYPLLNYLQPGQWGSFFTFGKRYADAQQTRYGWDFSGASNLEELQERLRASVMIRRMKTEVLKELPPKVRQIIEISQDSLSSEAKKALKKENSISAEWEKTLEKLATDVELAKAESEQAYQAAVTRMGEAQKVAFEEMAKARHDVAVAKVPTVVSQVKDMLESGEKIVVMAHHKDVVSLLMEAFNGDKELGGNIAVKLTGDTPMDERQANVDRFQNDPTCKIFIGNIQAAGVGITLTASRTVVFAELDWTPANMSQAEDRCYRIGQQNSVLIVHVVLEGSLDVKLAKTLIRKQEILEKALDKDTPITLNAQEVKPIEIDPEIEKRIEEAKTRVERLKALRDRQAQQKIQQAQAREEKAIQKEQDLETGATQEAKVSEIEKLASTLTPEQVSAIHSGLRMLAGLDTDRAREANGIGFNRIDGPIGHKLAEMDRLTPKQAALGFKLVRKYRKQLSEGILSQAGVN